MEPMELMLWAVAVIVACVAAIFVYGIISTFWQRLVVKPRTERRHLKAMKAFSATLKRLRSEGTLVIPKDVLDTFDGGTETQEEIAKPKPKVKQNTKPWPPKPTSPGNGQS